MDRLVGYPWPGNTRELRNKSSSGPWFWPVLTLDARPLPVAVSDKKADVFGYSMGAIAGLQLAIRHPAKVNKLVAASVAVSVIPRPSSIRLSEL
jgi:pimeloyl-ACP methyl ester carboxylesterase